MIIDDNFLMKADQFSSFIFLSSETRLTIHAIVSFFYRLPLFLCLLSSLSVLLID